MTAETPSPPSPSPAPSASKRGRGRPPGDGFHPTQEQREFVKALIGYRIPEDEVCLLVINPKTRKPIAPMTLRKHFGEEIKTGFATGRMRIMAASFRSAIGDKDHPGNVTAQIWLSKCLYGMREHIDIGVPGNLTEPANDDDAARLILFALRLGAETAKAKQPPKGKKL